VPEHSVADIRSMFASADLAALGRLVRRYASDTRPGVVEVVDVARKRRARHNTEQRRLEALFSLQRELHDQGIEVVAGVDEVGRGALAGPVSAAAVILPVEVRITGLNDSKALTPEQREQIAEEIFGVAVSVSIAHVDSTVIDQIGIAAANTRAMRNALLGLATSPGHAIIDGLRVELGLPTTAVVGGDRLVASVAAASIVAKVARDALMRENDTLYPAYGFAQNKGYGTLEHMAVIDAHGPCPLHRMSFSPCSQQHLF